MRWRRTVDRPGAAALVERLRGCTIAALERRAKFLLFTIASAHKGAPEAYLLVHLRMSGRLHLRSAGAAPEKHTRLVLALDNGALLCLDDVRKFGRVYLVRDPDEVLRGLGPEPLSAAFTPRVLAALLAGRNAAVKTLLLNQRIVAGIGNIYADEVLWRARIHPLRRAGSLSGLELSALYRAIRAVLRDAIAAEGTDAGDNVVRGDYRPRVYGRAGRPCRRCGAAIERLVVGQRGTHICPSCQSNPAPRRA